jgi:hypothetical protein
VLDKKNLKPDTAARMLEVCLRDNVPILGEFDGATELREVGDKVLEWCCSDDRQYLDAFPKENPGTEDDPYFMMLVSRRQRVGGIVNALSKLLDKST